MMAGQINASSLTYIEDEDIAFKKQVNISFVKNIFH